MKKKNINVYMILLLLLLLVQNSFATTIIETQTKKEPVATSKQKVVKKTTQPRRRVLRTRVPRTSLTRQKKVATSKSSIPKNVPIKDADGKNIVYVPFEQLKTYKDTLDKNKKEIAKLNVDLNETKNNLDETKNKVITLEQKQEKLVLSQNNIIEENENLKTSINNYIEKIRKDFSLLWTVLAVFVLAVIGLAIKLIFMNKNITLVRNNVEVEINLLKHTNTKEFEKITQNIKAENRSILDKLHLHTTKKIEETK